MLCIKQSQLSVSWKFSIVYVEIWLPNNLHFYLGSGSATKYLKQYTEKGGVYEVITD